MGNAESGPVMGDRRRDDIEDSSSGSYDENDDWDYDVSVIRNENMSPNHKQSFHPSFLTMHAKTSTLARQKESFESPTSRRRFPKEPEEDRYSHSMDETSSDEDEDEDELSDEDDSSDERTATSTLMEASAAVFHMLMTTDSDSGFVLSEDVSISDRSAAIFEYLRQESKSGNDEPTRQFLETAQAVSDVLLTEEYNHQPLPGHYDNTKEVKKGTRRAPTGIEDDCSVSQQRAAIFQALDRTSRTPEKKDEDSRRSPHMIQWLETKNDTDAQSVVSEMSEGIFKIMDQTKGKVDEEDVSGFSAAIFKLREGHPGSNAMDEFATKLHKDDDSDVQSISERSAAIFKILDKTAAPAVIAKTPRRSEQTSAFSTPSTAPSLARPSSILTGQKTLSSHLVSHLQPRSDPTKLMQRNIFHILAQRTNQSIPAIQEEENEDEEDDGVEVNRMEENERHWHNPEIFVVERRAQDHLVLHVEESPRHASTPLRQQSEKPKLPAYIENHPSDTSEMYPSLTESVPEPVPLFSEVIHADPSEQEQYEPVPVFSEVIHTDTSEQEQYEPVPVFSEVIHADTSEQDKWEAQSEKDEDDMAFVERFDNAFNAFIGRHPRFLLNNPKLVQNIRTTKLQKLLEHVDDYQSSLLSKMAKLKGEKFEMESNFQYDLREASRRKAEAQISLQAELATITQSTSLKGAELTWKIVNSSEARAKKQYIISQNQKTKRSNFAKENVSGIPTRDEILTLLPCDAEGTNLKAAIYSQRKFMSFQHGEAMELEELRKYQVDNAFMSSEIAVLKKKLTYLQANAKRLTWVDTILLRMDKVQMAKLKNKYCKKLGVSLE